MDGITNSNLNKTNTAEFSPKERLEKITARMAETRLPANRIYEAMRVQLEGLRREFERFGGTFFREQEQKDLTERMDSILKLSDIYEKTNRRAGYSPDAIKQEESVKQVIATIEEQKLYVKQHSVENEIVSAKNLAKEYSEAVRKSTESYVVSLRELGNMSNARENEAGKGATFDERACDKIRIGMAAIALYDRLTDPDGGEKFFENFVRPQKDFGKAIQSIATSTEFKRATVGIMTTDGVKGFTADPAAPKKLWNSFEKEIMKKQASPVKEHGKEINRDAAKEASKTATKMM